MDKEKLKKAIDKNSTIITHDDEWRYPHQDDTQKSCPLLQVMFDIEYKAGTIIFIPDEKKPIPKVAGMTKKDLYG